MGTIAGPGQLAEVLKSVSLQAKNKTHLRNPSIWYSGSSNKRPSQKPILQDYLHNKTKPPQSPAVTRRVERK